MTLTRELETLFFIALASVIGLFAVYMTRQPKDITQLNISSPLPAFIAQSSPTPTPTLAPVLPKPTTVSWNSSDGKYKVNMTLTINTDTTKTYAFTVTNITDNTTTSLFSKTLPATVTMAIPFNAFSPDDSYIYLKEIDGEATQYYLFKSSGEAFVNGSTFVNITPLFAAYTANYTLEDITGWADPTLLVVNTKSTDGKTVSFWFDVTSKSFIPLSHVFE